MTVILDYSWARPSPQSCKDYPAIGVMRYLGNDWSGRDIGPDELAALLGAGLGVGFVFETSANRVLQGYDAGCWDADSATKYMVDLGVPNDIPVYFAADCDVNPAQSWGVVMDYYAGALGCAHPARSYGEADVLDMCFDTFGMRHGWQPAATSWSDGRLSVNASMWQRWPYVMNDQCDQNDVLCPDDQIDWLFGGCDMPLSQSDLNAIKNVVYDCVNTTLANMYTGSRAVEIDGRAEVWELVTNGGVLSARYIGEPQEIGALQYLDRLAGKRGDPPRKLSDPKDIEWFDRLPKIGFDQRDTYALDQP